jgi:hypothetical protein
MAANPLAVSPSPPVSWLDTDLFGRLPLPLHLIGNADTDAIVARARELARGSKAAETGVTSRNGKNRTLRMPGGNFWKQPETQAALTAGVMDDRSGLNCPSLIALACRQM